MLISVQYRRPQLICPSPPRYPNIAKRARARRSSGGHTVRLAGTMAPPPDAVPDEVQAALSGMMEQLAAPTEAEREQQYDVLAGMLAAATASSGSAAATEAAATEASTSTPPPSVLAAATACSSPSFPEPACAGSSATTSDAPPIPGEARAATTQGRPAASEDASNGNAKSTRVAKSSHVAQQKIEAVRGHDSELEHPAALCGPCCSM